MHSRRSTSRQYKPCVTQIVLELHCASWCFIRCRPSSVLFKHAPCQQRHFITATSPLVSVECFMFSCDRCYGTAMRPCDYWLTSEGVLSESSPNINPDVNRVHIGWRRAIRIGIITCSVHVASIHWASCDRDDDDHLYPESCSRRFLFNSEMKSEMKSSSPDIYRIHTTSSTISQK